MLAFLLNESRNACTPSQEHQCEGKRNLKAENSGHLFVSHVNESADRRRGQHPDEEGAHGPRVLPQHVRQNSERSRADGEGIRLVSGET